MGKTMGVMISQGTAFDQRFSNLPMITKADVKTAQLNTSALLGYGSNSPTAHAKDYREQMKSQQTPLNMISQPIPVRGTTLGTILVPSVTDSPNKRDLSPEVFAGKPEAVKPLVDFRQSKSTIGINLDVLTEQAPKTVKSPTAAKPQNVSAIGPTKFENNYMNASAGDHVVLEDDYTPSLWQLPQVSCKTYCIIDGIKGKSLYHKGDSEIREIASLTKIMTAHVALQLTKQL